MDSGIQKHVKPALRMGTRFLTWILLALVVLYALSGIYSVSPNEMGVHQRFGKVVNDRVPPGIHYRLPWPVDRVDRIPVHQVQRIQITDFSGEGKRGLCLTGDNNLVNLDCIIQYKVSDPFRYLFGFREKHGERLLSDAACTTLIHCLAGLPVDLILTFGKQSIERKVKERLQETLDEVDSGLLISFIELKRVRAPAGIKQYFDDVINAKIDKSKSINLAESYRNEEIPAAKARANRLIQEGEAYRTNVVTEAEGDTKRFLDILSEYSKAKDVTRRRLLIDTARRILVNIDKAYVVDSPEDSPPPKLKIFKK